MPKLPVVKARELIKVLKKLGFVKTHQVGSHAQFKHPNGKKVTIPIHPGKDLKRGLLRGILKDLEISVEEFIKLFRD